MPWKRSTITQESVPDGTTLIRPTNENPYTFVGRIRHLRRHPATYKAGYMTAANAFATRCTLP
ncbi:hypothetical protein MC62_023760 [Citrobacter freundii]|nr:hypothetical protein MC62_023760 [Citrobacter freundii]PSF21556.1 hypothetical protein C6985_16475 [Escherichia coli]AYL44797.1 hypothetical protein CUC45_22365 [Citrobacter freundii]NFV66751.1 hypothetical protein [Citrobacter freundii]PUU65457.1 hypothetical protein DCL23_06535 [Citrobacter freundii]